MSTNKTLMSVLIAAASLALLAGLLTTVSVRSQEQSNGRPATVVSKGLSPGNQANTQTAEKEIDDAATPVVDFEAAATMTTAQNSSARSLKNERYNKSGLVRDQPSASTSDVRMYSDPMTPLSDLPVDESDAVIEGEVVSAEAFLSDDKSGVYSEFTVRVSQTLKVRPGLSMTNNDTIVTERLGGRVRYPSGKIVRYRIAGEGSPMVGARYLFFLKQAVQGNYSILTAYELRGNKVVALDGSRASVRERGQTIFDKHNEQEPATFMDEVKRAVQSSSSGKQATETAHE